MNWKYLGSYFWHWYCSNFDHKWVSVGGRACPKSDIGVMIIDGQPEICSQSVYRCSNCKEWDYGYSGSPAWEECHNCFI